MYIYTLYTYVCIVYINDSIIIYFCSDRIKTLNVVGLDFSEKKSIMFVCIYKLTQIYTLVVNIENFKLVNHQSLKLQNANKLIQTYENIVHDPVMLDECDTTKIGAFV